MRLCPLATACIMLCGCAAGPTPDGRATTDGLRAELEKMSRTPYGDGGPCSLHGTEQKLDRVRVAYGFVVFSPDFLKARNEQFPNAQTFSLGGCTRIPGSPRRQAVYYCPQCRKAEKEWERLHPVASRPPEDESTRPQYTP